MKNIYMNYIGKKVLLFPGDTYYKYAVIEDVNELGWTFKITQCHRNSGYDIGDVLFYNHATKVTFKFVN